MMEKVRFREYDPKDHVPAKPWATTGKPKTRPGNVITSLHIQPEKMEEINLRLQEKYRQIERKEMRYETMVTDDAEYLIVAYGLVARIAHKAVEIAREEGVKVGLLRPITLYPFPYAPVRALADSVRGVLTVEMNAGQMVEDVRLAVEGRTPVAFYGRMGGVIPSPEEIVREIKILAGKKRMTQHAEAY
jgi:2-oxoglutarate ferredoxin oxidoreductase subunit alpha